MVLVDTSVWIRFLANQGPYASGLDALLSRDEVVGHPFVFGELLIGDRGGRSKLLTAYRQMSRAPLVQHDEVVTFVDARKLNGRGVGWIDVHLLASAVISRSSIWTADPRFDAVADELGVSFNQKR